MDEVELLRLSDLNYAESQREFSRWQASPSILETSDLLMTCGPSRAPMSNRVMRVGLDATPPAAEVIEMAKRFFGEHDRRFSIQTRMHVDEDLIEACEGLGLANIMNEPGMVLESPSPDIEFEDDVVISVVTDSRIASDFSAVVSGGFKTLGLKPDFMLRLLALPERWMQPHLYAVVAYLEGRPASSAMLLLSHGIAGIYLVSTVEWARGRGLAELCTRVVGNEGFRRGARFLTLQASTMGEPIYRRMGYREITRYPLYMYPRSK